MLRALRNLFGYHVGATDGEIGKVHNFFFDDERWVVRYLVVETGSWLSSRRVLIAPAALGHPDWERRIFPVSLTRDQVRHSPDVDTDKPVSRQQEIVMSQYYGWPHYWIEGLIVMPSSVTMREPVPSEKAEGDPHLRSVREVVGYHILAVGGEIGHVEDFLADDDGWTVRYIEVDTRNWLPGKKVLVAPEWVEKVSWAERRVVVGLPRGRIEKSPEYNPAAAVSREYEAALHDYYGRGKYWE